MSTIFPTTCVADARGLFDSLTAKDMGKVSDKGMVIYVQAMRGAEMAVVSLRLAARTMRVAPVLRMSIYMAIITLLSTSSLVTLRFDTSMTKTAL